jgi:hypothetical protein
MITASSTATSAPTGPVTTPPLVAEDQVVLSYPGGNDPTPVVTVNVPDGWQTFGGWAVLKNGAQAPTGMGFGVWSVANLYTDPCQWSGALLNPPVGSTVGDLVTALAEVWESDATAPTDVIIDGFAGKQITLTVPADIDFADCDSGQFRSWTAPDGGARYYQGPGQVEQNWILDVDGVRLLIGAGHFPVTAPEDQAELQEVIESIEIESA